MSEESKKQVECNGEMDSLFRKTLGNVEVEPAPKVWKGINRKLLLTELVHFKFNNVPKMFWVGSGAALVIGLIFLFNQIPDGKNTGSNYSPVILNNNVTNTASAGISKSDNRNQKVISNLNSKRNDVTSLQKELTNNQSVSTSKPIVSANNSSAGLTHNSSKNKGIKTSPVSGKTVTINTLNQPSGENNLIASLNRKPKTNDLNYLPSLYEQCLFPLSGMDTMLRITNQNGILNVPVLTKTPTPQFFTYNMGVAPELSVYRNSNQYSEGNYWLNSGITYHVGRFSVQTGVGVGYVFDQSAYKVNYKSKDSIGYFTSIISFYISPGDKIIYTTKDIAVYDSVEHVADNRAMNRYTYLQIPLYLGYEIFESDRLNVEIKAGPAISFLIGTKEASPFIDYPNAHLIRIDNNTYSRVKMNWELMAALDIEYKLDKTFSIYAEPTYKHYFKPFENQESTLSKAKDPYSVGIELGIRVNFGQKRKNND